MFYLIFLSIFSIFFNFFILINDETFLLFIFLSFYYLIIIIYMRFTIKYFIFKKIFKNYAMNRTLHWMNIYLGFLNSAFFLYLKYWLKPLINSKKIIVFKILNNIKILFKNSYLNNILKIEYVYCNSLKIKILIIKTLSKFINLDKVFIINNKV